MKHKLLSFFVGSMILTSVAFAQERTVSGHVTGVDGKPLAGVTIIVQGSNTATQTDANGNYSLSVPNGKVIVFRSVGFADKTLIVKEGQSAFNVTLDNADNALDEVVVTAMGITRSEKSLGYSATKIGGAELAASRNTNVANALAGKVAGVQVNSTGASPGAVSSVVIRGFSSINGSNQALYVVDGVPLQTSNFQTDGTTIAAGGISSISSDDIESMTVLKGAAATALYGSRASNGVVVITTKSGKKGNGRNFSLSYNGGMQFREMSVFPIMQNEFGQGWNGQQTYIENGSWGPRLDGSQQLFGPVWDNKQLYHEYSARKNNVKDFLDIGKSFNNSIAFNGASEDNKLTYYLSYSNTKDDGIMPTDADSYKRNTLAYRSTYQGTDWLKVSSNLNFTTNKTNVVGTYQGTSVIDGLLELPRDISIIDKKDLSSPFNTPEAYFTPYGITNPYWALANNYNQLNSKQFNGKIQADINPIKELTLTYRFGFDHLNYDQKIGVPEIKLDDKLITDNKGYPPSAMNQAGNVFSRYGSSYELNHDFLATYDNKFDKLSLTALLGMNINERYSTYMQGQTDGLSVYTGFWDLSNGSVRSELSEVQTKRRLVGLFGDVTLGYDETVFLNLTARNDWSSTLPINKNNYFYPGATLSWLFTNNLPKNNILSFGKARLAYGRTGNDAGVYQTTARYIQGFANGYYGSDIAKFPLNGTNSFLLSTQKGSDQLSPEMTTEFEAGLDLKFLNNRIGLDAVFYNRRTTDQIFPLSVDPASGFATMVTNVGEVRNRGIELLLSTTPIKTEKFRWDLNLNLTINRNKVISLDERIGDKFQIYNFSAGNDNVSMYAEVGKPLGTFYTYLPTYVEDASSPYYGKLIVDDEYGQPVLTKDIMSTGLNIQPKWTGGATTSFSAYGFTLGATLDIRQGGYMFSRTKNLMQFTGNGIETMYNDRNPFIIPNSAQRVLDKNGNFVRYQDNTTPIYLSNSSYQNYFNNYGAKEGGQYYLLDRSFRKIRNISLSYVLPKSWVSSAKLSDVALTAFVNNPFVWTPKSNKFIDPEGSSIGSDLSGQFGELYINPATRIYGFNVSLKF
ncbi:MULTISPECIES: SusC/RagA family TonB-linked outer membrane protein [Sphingobacterium]|uniref:SusC/RagA family TonB-linked outer membrane protein n=1 Tax=Sphingobacterium TaxID=28453 RepID=UPI00257F719F|nr:MULTISPECIES: SusC/RagA family TonB-linked outer membrane protein [Sphingobacterium]